MFKKFRGGGVLGIAAVALCLAPTRAWAAYYWGGNGMEEITGGTISDGALFTQSVAAWGTSYTNVAGGYSTQFSTPACNDVVNSRLVLAVYGGMASNTCNLSVTVNGNTTNVAIGGTGDSNPEFTANQTNVYGSMSSGAWVVSIPETGNLTTNGNPTNVNITETSSTGFDGRIVYASLWDVYQKASLNNTFQYAVAEGSGDIYQTTPSTAQSPTTPYRWVEMGGFETSNLQAATLDTLYTYVHPGQDNHLYINGSDASNGTLLGGDPAVSSTTTYAPVQASFDVTSDLSATDNWLKFSVDPADGVSIPATGLSTSVLRPQVAILEATIAAAPLPAALWVGLLGLGGLLAIRWKSRVIA